MFLLHWLIRIVNQFVTSIVFPLNVSKSINKRVKSTNFPRIPLQSMNKKVILINLPKTLPVHWVINTLI